MIYITGDTHGSIDVEKLSFKSWGESRTLTKSDYLIICGDFGFLWDGSKEDRYWLKWLEDRPYTILFCDGNHENFNILNSYPVESWCGGNVHKISPSVIHLMRGQVFTINDKTFFVMGGAESHDKPYRVLNRSWWQEEVPSREEYDTGIRNLERVNFNVDYVISHTAPARIIRALFHYETKDITTFMLQDYSCIINFKQWFFGHHHQDAQFVKYTALYNTIKEII